MIPIPSLISEMHPTTRLVFLILFFVGMGWIVLSRFYIYFEQVFAKKYKRPFFLNSIIFRRQISQDKRRILEKEFSFYQKLSTKQKRIFRHRLANFLRNKEFVGRDNFEITTEVETLIGATAVMLTFGLKNYQLDVFHTILVYPKSFYSKQGGTLHKGEFNPRMGLIAFSWEDFKFGYDISNDNLNLGIHEFGHAMHFNSFKNGDISSIIFSDTYKDLKRYLRSDEEKRKALLDSKYFRAYAYTNEFEFFSVLLECFMETPRDFKAQFPKLYGYVKQMLNFNFAGY
ncbi:zinc-dependent peptidase [Winogradskyella maritima]|uniref:Zinc-dependent peptidase n=2 Tax=Winogradskyella maritima TaxID=1517766 RepID=A0ABV8AFT1_9FLAO